jgi:hypothetical protein
VRTRRSSTGSPWRTCGPTRSSWPCFADTGSGPIATAASATPRSWPGCRKRFVDETLWPEYQEISETLRSYLSDVTDRVVQQVIHQDSSEAEVIEKPKQLPLGFDQPDVMPPTAPTTTPKPDQQPNPSGQAGAGSKNRNKNKRKRKKRKRR